ncbi:Collagen alpha-1(VII) chain, partial [Geodia barretti]
GIPPPTNVKAVQDGLTSIIVSWTLSSNATGYRIYYDSSGGHGGFEDVTNGSTDNYTLEGLQTETHYTILIMATSEDHPPSTLVELNIYLISPPGKILLAVLSVTPTSISLSWSVGSGSVMGWEVFWRDSNGNVTENTSGSLSGTNYTINDLLTTTSYSVRVRAVNVVGTTESPHIIIVTSNFSNV